jgi:hypothetical protein
MNSVKKFKTIFSRIKESLNLLTTNEEKKEIVNGFKEIISFLESLKDVFINMPSLEEAEKAKDAIIKLESIIEKNPLIKEIIFGKPAKYKKSPTPVKPQKKIEISGELVEKKLGELKKHSEEEIKNLLDNEKDYPKPLLIAIAEKLGRRVSSKTTRKELITNIATMITNIKTYEGLMKNE